MLDPRQLVRWVHVARLSVATAILLAAAFAWTSAPRRDTLVATLAFAGAVAWTALAATLDRRRGSGEAPRVPTVAASVAVDLALAAATVHVTGGGASQFAALYVLVVAYAALLLPAAGGALAVVAADVLYGAEAVWLRPGAAEGGGGVALQLVVFGAVALASGVVGARMRAAGTGGRRLAAALERASVEAADILRAIRSGILTVDADGVLLYANPAAGALLGFPLHDRLGAPVLDEIAARAPELADVLRQAACRGEKTTRAEGTIARGDGVRRIGVTTTAAGRSGAGTAIFSDITDSKRLEALHVRAERLEAIAELSASLAHEIKNPLASIRSATEQLARFSARRAVAAGEDDDDERTLATLIVRESDRLSRLLSEFLDFARARVRRVERLDLGAAARAAAQVAAAHPARAEGVRVDVVVPHDAADVDGDAELLHQALLNLALNAVQATPAGGRVRVEVQLPDAEELPPGLAFDGGAVAVHVTDSGAGIPPDVVDRLFDPFFTTKPTGSGLGLAVVHRVVEAHRGVVLVEGGGCGVGARFTLLLPRAPERLRAPVEMT